MTPARLRAVLFPLLLGCGSTPVPRSGPSAAAGAPEPSRPAADPCADGEWASAPPSLVGLARGARCEAEVASIMTETARALGVSCEYCHERGDFARATPRKEVANWMATKLAPSLRRRGGGAVGCADCHASGGQGVAKILGSPRRQDRSVEWMTTVLGERFETATGAPLYCRTCHLENVGQPGFAKTVILTDHLPSHALPPGGTDG